MPENVNYGNPNAYPTNFFAEAEAEIVSTTNAIAADYHYALDLNSTLITVDEVREKIRKEGNEFGATTGRARRCGWVDLPALKYAVMINGVTELSMMKADVLSVFEKIKVCTHYKINDELEEYLPYDITNLEIEPIYEELEGWNCDLTELDSYDNAPQALKNYVAYLEKALEVPITVVSVGPDRKQTLNNQK